MKRFNMRASQSLSLMLVSLGLSIAQLAPVVRDSASGDSSRSANKSAAPATSNMYLLQKIMTPAHNHLFNLSRRQRKHRFSTPCVTVPL